MSSPLLSAWPTSAVEDLVDAVKAEVEHYLPQAVRNFEEGKGGAADMIASVRTGAETLLRYVEDAEGELNA